MHVKAGYDMGGSLSCSHKARHAGIACLQRWQFGAFAQALQPCCQDGTKGSAQHPMPDSSQPKPAIPCRSYEVSMLGLVRTKVPLLELRGVRGLGRLTYKAPFFCPEPHRTVHATKVSVAQADGVPALVGERSCGTLCTLPQHACCLETDASALLPAWVSQCSLHQPGNT